MQHVPDHLDAVVGVALVERPQDRGDVDPSRMGIVGLHADPHAHIARHRRDGRDAANRPGIALGAGTARPGEDPQVTGPQVGRELQVSRGIAPELVVVARLADTQVAGNGQDLHARVGALMTHHGTLPVVKADVDAGLGRRT